MLGFGFWVLGTAAAMNCAFMDCFFTPRARVGLVRLGGRYRAKAHIFFDWPGDSESRALHMTAAQCARTSDAFSIPWKAPVPALEVRPL